MVTGAHAAGPALRLQIPATLSLNQALPTGSLVLIAQGGTSEFRTVGASGGDTITLADGLANSFALADPNDLPTVGSSHDSPPHHAMMMARFGDRAEKCPGDHASHRSRRAVFNPDHED